jgi:hypothetical protein
VSIGKPKQRQVIRYGYLWLDEARGGHESARKDRPCAIVLVAPDERNRDQVVVAPITHRRPTEPGTAIELPRWVKAQLGLDDERSWIVTAEVNRFIWPGPDLQLVDDTATYGDLPMPIFRQLVKALQVNVRAGRLRIVKRTE